MTATIYERHIWKAVAPIGEIVMEAKTIEYGPERYGYELELKVNGQVDRTQSFTSESTTPEGVLSKLELLLHSMLEANQATLV